MRKSANKATHDWPRPFDTGMTETQRLERRSNDSEKMIAYYDKVDAIIGGIETAVKHPGFLIKFPGEEKEAFDFRKSVAKLTNIYRDNVESLAVKPFEEEVKLPGENIPADIEAFIEDVDGRGNNLHVFLGEVFFNGINSTHHWILVDYPAVEPGTVRTIEERKSAGIRPFFNHILARNVFEVRTIRISGKETLAYIRVFEPAANGHNDRFSEWELIAGVVQLTKWEKNKRGEYEQIEQRRLTISRIPIVPFIASRRDGDTWQFDPALRDALELQVTLFRQESALEFAKTMTAFPMLAGNGVSPPKDGAGKPVPLKVGPHAVLYAPRDGNGQAGSWAYVEPGAQSLKFLADDVKETKQDLRELGKQPLTAQSGNLTVITTAVAAGKAKSVVGAWGLALKDAAENAMVLACEWFGITPAEYDPEVSVYDGYDDFADAAQETATLTEARKNGDLSQKTYWEELKRRGVLSPEFDAEEEAKLILDEVPGDGENPPDLTRQPIDPQNPQPGETTQ